MKILLLSMKILLLSMRWIAPAMMTMLHRHPLSKSLMSAMAQTMSQRTCPLGNQRMMKIPMATKTEAEAESARLAGLGLTTPAQTVGADRSAEQSMTTVVLVLEEEGRGTAARARTSASRMPGRIQIGRMRTAITKIGRTVMKSEAPKRTSGTQMRDESLRPPTTLEVGVEEGEAPIRAVEVRISVNYPEISTAPATRIMAEVARAGVMHREMREILDLAGGEGGHGILWIGAARWHLIGGWVGGVV